MMSNNFLEKIYPHSTKKNYQIKRQDKARNGGFKSEHNHEFNILLRFLIEGG